MGSTCKQGKPNGNLKTNGRVPHWAEDDPKSEGSPSAGWNSGKLTLLLEKGATYLTNNKKGGEIGDK